MTKLELLLKNVVAAANHLRVCDLAGTSLEHRCPGCAESIKNVEAASALRAKVNH